MQRTFPHFASDPSAYRDALSQKAALRAASKAGRRGSWEFAGPSNIGGRVVDLAIHPDQPRAVYAAAATGGVFRSEDMGQSWTPIFDEQPFLSIGDMAIAPSDPNVLYVGTGEANGGHNNYAGGGLYKSTDRGATWSYAGLEETVSIGRVIVHPDDPNRVWVAGVGSYFAPNSERGVFKTVDGGQSWSKTLFVNDSTGVVDLAMKPGDPEILFASSWQRVRRVTGSFLYGRGSGVHRSVDGGETWELLGPSRGLPDPDAHLDENDRVRIGRIGLASSESSPETLYAYYTNGSGYLGLYRSTDGGNSWVDANPSGEIPKGRNQEFGFSWFFGQVRVHPTDPMRLYVLDVTLHQSRDGGATWDAVAGTHVDHHAMVYDPSNDSAIFEGNDGGVALTLNGGLSWEKVAPLPITQFYEIAVDPARPERLFGGTQDNGTVYTARGATDNWTQIWGGDGFYVLPIPTDATRVYAESQNGGLAQITGLFSPPGSGLVSPPGSGLPVNTGIPSSERRNWAVPLAMDPYNENVIYYATHRVWRSEAGAGTTFTPISSDLTRGTDIAKLGTISTMAVSSVDPDVIWVGTDDGKVWVSWNYGTDWNDVTGENLPFRWITRVVPSPVDVGTAYVTFSGLKWRDATPHVFKTTTLGQAWQDITADLPDTPVNALAVDPEFPDRIFVGTDIGMFMSLDDGGSWTPFDDDIPAVTVTDLKTVGRRLVAGTHGRGMYLFDLNQLNDPTFTDADPSIPRTLSVAPPFPNPFSITTRVQVDGRLTGSTVYDLLGRVVATPEVIELGQGSSLVRWDGYGLGGESVADGTYILLVTGPEGQASVPLVRVR